MIRSCEMERATRPCVDETEDPCYYRAPNHECTRTANDGPCIHAERIAKRKAKKTKETK